MASNSQGSQDNVMGGHEKKRVLGFPKALSGLRILGHIPDYSIVSELDK